MHAKLKPFRLYSASLVVAIAVALMMSHLTEAREERATLRHHRNLSWRYDFQLHHVDDVFRPEDGSYKEVRPFHCYYNNAIIFSSFAMKQSIIVLDNI